MFFKGVITILVVLCLLYGCVLLAMAYYQERLIFFPEVLSPDHKFIFKSEFEEHLLDVKGEKVHSLLFKVHDSQGVVLFFHGNAGSLESWGQVGEELADKTQWDVWVVDFPGYGKSLGKITSENQLIDLGKTLVSEAKKKYGPHAKIAIFGRSLGTGIAVKMASENEFAGLILETPYLSLVSMARRLYSWVPSFALRYKLRSDLWIKLVKCPVLIIHGTRDEVIPYEQGKALAEASGKANFLTIEGGTHGNLGSYPIYWKTVEEFFESF